MSVRLKLTLGISLLIAGFLVVRIGLYFKNSAVSISFPSVKGVSSPSSEDNLSIKDSDHDGIPDMNEAYYRTDPFNQDTDGDGYRDGEEIASAFNPTRADEGEKKNTELANITGTLTQRFVSGIYAGDLNPRNGKGTEYNTGVDYLALATIDDALGKINQEIDNNSILTTDSSKASQEEYLKNIAGVLEGPFLNAFMQQPQVLNQALSLAAGGQFEQANQIFSDYNLKFTQAYTGLLATPAPDNWVDFHKHLLNFFQKIALEYDYATKWQDDPMLALTAVSDLARTLGIIDISILQDLKSLIDKNNLKVPDSNFFEVLGLLNSNPLKQ